MKADRVRADGRAYREDAGRLRAVARRLDQKIASGAVEPGQNDDRLAGIELGEAWPPRRVDLDPRFAAPLARLAPDSSDTRRASSRASARVR